MNKSPLEVAQSYLKRGWIPLPVPFRSKNPNFRNWQNFVVTTGQLSRHFDGKEQNIGVLLGVVSGNLVDVDIDCDEGREMAQHFMPNTGAIFGRKSSPRSHWLYVSTITKKVAFTDPVTRKRLLEVLTNGQQSIFPGSCHKDTGELIRWYEDAEPFRIDQDVLLRGTRQLSAACLLVRHWPSKGTRQEAAMALAGGLLMAGWSDHSTTHFIEVVCSTAGDEETSQRIKTVCATSAKIHAQANVTGWSTLALLLDERVVTTICKWLQISNPQPRSRRNSIMVRPDLQSESEQPVNGHPQGGTGQPLCTPALWFAERFPDLAREYGDAILELTNRFGVISARDICEDFFAATLGERGSPSCPTVFVPAESKFLTYSSSEGVFIHQREPTLLTKLSGLLLDCSRSCRDSCDTRALEFRARNASKLSGVLRKARGLLEVSSDFFSKDLSEMLPCANGMLRLSDRQLLPFSPSYKRRNKLEVPYDGSAKCPMFLDTLMRPALDGCALDLLQRWCGLALMGQNLAQKILILTGTAGGGKGTFVRVLNGIIGCRNLASLRPALLGERFELGRFLGKTLLYGADVPENFLNQRGASVLKSLTGYDPITLEFKNSNETPSIVCAFNVIVTSNSRLTVHLEGDTEAWRRRLAMVDYHNYKPRAVIAELDQIILRTEGAGVLNWMLEGLDKLRRDKWSLVLNSSQERLVDNLLLESEGHILFARENLVPAEGQLTVEDCFGSYVEYCNERGWRALTRNKFGQMIGDVVTRQYGFTLRHDIEEAGKSQRGWRGIQLKATL